MNTKYRVDIVITPTPDDDGETGDTPRYITGELWQPGDIHFTNHSEGGVRYSCDVNMHLNKPRFTKD